MPACAKKIIVPVLALFLSTWWAPGCDKRAPEQRGTSGQKEQYLAAVSLLNARKPRPALDIFKNLMESHPDFDKAYIKAVESYQALDSLDVGLAYFSRRRSQNGKNPYLHYASGLIYAEKDKPKRAFDHFRRSIDLSPAYLPAYQALVDAGTTLENPNAVRVYLTGLLTKHPQNAGVLFALGYLHQLDKQWQQSLDYYDRALAVNPELLDIYQKKSAVYYYTGQFHKLLTEATRAEQKAGDKQDIEYQCKFLANMGLAYIHLAEFEDAAGLLVRALHLARELGDKSREMRILGNLGVIDKDSQQHARALEYFNQALNIAHQLADSQCIGLFTRNVGSVHYHLSDYDRALHYYEKALPVLLLTGDKNSEALVQWSIGGVYWNFGDYPRALDYYQKAYRLAEETGNKWGRERYLGTMGLTYSRMGRYDEALQCVEQALKTAREIGEKTGEALRLGDLAAIYHDMGYDARAIEYYQKALDIAAETGNKREKSKFLGKLGEIERQNNNYDRALRHYNSALEIAQDIKNKNLQSELLGQIGYLYFYQNDYAGAKSTIEKGLDIARDLKNRSIQARLLLFLAHIFYQSTDLTASKKYYNLALENGQNLAEPAVVWNALQGLARVEEAQGKDQRALRLYEKAISEMDKVRENLVTETFKIGFLESHISIYENIIHLLSKLHNGRPGRGYDRLAFTYAEKAKAGTLLEIVRQGSVVNNLTDIPELFRKELLSNREKLESRHKSLSDELAKAVQEQDKTGIDSLHHEIDRLDRRQQKLIQELKQKHPDYYRLTNPQIIDPPRLQADILDDDKVLLEYFVGEKQTYVWTLTKKEIRFETIPMTRKALRDKLGKTSPLFKSQNPSGGVVVDYAFADIQPDSLRKLYHLLLKDYVPKNTKQLILVPDDILYYFPFDILVTSKPGEKPRYLVEDFPISYASSADLLALVSRCSTKTPKNLLALGDPRFGRFSRTSVQRLFSGATSRGPLRDQPFEPLPYSKQEVKSIGENFTDKKLLTGGDATETNFVTLAPKFNYIHLATHFITDDQHPMYSKIIFTPDTGPGRDGFLHTFEVYDLKLDADMVVLSGCGSGLGKLRRGEGIIGMSRGFLYAGVPSMVVSLWPVEDESTADLMGRFYRYLTSGASKSRALQQAKIDLIRTSDWKNDPFYWGAFILTGSGC